MDDADDRAGDDAGRADDAAAGDEPAADDLAAAAADLAASLEALRDDVAPRPRRGPFGLPRPPRPVELLRFADDHAIPTVIALLEANVRALELLRAALRLADP